ncbi:MAG: hypothetical protein KDA98_15980, partial [Acidimicrobiales bacterium]|nr:hypothetical protein [Acidimicrobiales bacterium]
KELDDLGVKKPFDIAFDAEGNAFVTGTESDNVVKLDPEGNLLKTFPGFSRPMGIISNSQGEQWVSNSRLIDLPCPDKNVDNEADPSVANIDANDVVTTYTGGGVWIPWG